MDCPHCLSENLIGAAICAGCGASLRAKPPRAAPSPPSGSVHGVPASRSQDLPMASPLDDGYITPVSLSPPMPPAVAPQEVACRRCTTQFAWRLGDPNLCPSCRRDVRERTGEIGVVAAPAVGAFHGERIERERPRTGPVRRSGGGLGRAFAAIVIGSVLVGSGFAVVKFVNKKSDPGGALVQHVRGDSAKLVMAPPANEVERISASLRLHTVCTNANLGFGTTAKLVDFTQKSTQSVEISLVRPEGRGAVVDVLVTCQAGDQTGRIREVRDPRTKDIFPFAGHTSTLRMSFAPDAPPVQVDGLPAVAGRDILPLVSIGAIGAGARDVEPSTHWRAELELPCTTDREAKLLVERFPAEVTYIGRTTHKGFVCAAFRIVATAPSSVPEELTADFDKRQARIAGAVLYELSTGLVIAGSLDVTQRFWKVSGDGEELKLDGRLELSRE